MHHANEHSSGSNCFGKIWSRWALRVLELFMQNARLHSTQLEFEAHQDL